MITERKETVYIVIHCADTPDGNNRWTDHDIYQWHTRPPPRGNGWSDIGYQRVILVSGEVKQGRPDLAIGAHCKNLNAVSYGICMMGTERFTVKQWAALKEEVKRVKEKYRSISLIIGHRDWNKEKDCPGFDVSMWLLNGMEPLEDHIYKEEITDE